MFAYSLAGFEDWDVIDECESGLKQWTLIDALSIAVGSGFAKLHNILI